MSKTNNGKNNALVEALSPLESTEERVEVLEGILEEQLSKIDYTKDLLEVDDSELEVQDRASLGRLTYVVSLLRLLGYLRSTPTGASPSDMAHKQAMAGFQYIRHVEGTNLRFMQFGRSSSDTVLRKEVEELRKEMHKIAKSKAQVLNRGTDE